VLFELQLQKNAAGCWSVSRRHSMFCQLSSKLPNKFKYRVLQIFRTNEIKMHLALLMISLKKRLSQGSGLSQPRHRQRGSKYNKIK